MGHHGHHKHIVEDFKKRFLISTALTLPILVLDPMLWHVLGIKWSLTFPGYTFFVWAISTAIFLYGGFPFISGLVDEIRSKAPGMMTLIGVAISVAYIYSSLMVFGLPGKMFFLELVTLIDIMLLGHYIEMKSVMGASKALESLASLLPQVAHKIEHEGHIVDVPLQMIKPGDLVLVKPGEKIPADGIVIEGETSVNEMLLTGESSPVYKKKGDRVIGGSVNNEGSIKVQVERTGKDSFISQVIELVRKAQESKSKTQNLADRSAFWLTIIAITAGIVTLLSWILFAKVSFSFALERAVTVMVITCPHALVWQFRWWWQFLLL